MTFKGHQLQDFFNVGVSWSFWFNYISLHQQVWRSAFFGVHKDFGDFPLHRKEAGGWPRLVYPLGAMATKHSLTCYFHLRRDVFFGKETLSKSRSMQSWCWVHPGKFTWNRPITQFKRKLIFQTSMAGFHVNFPGCICLDWLPVRRHHKLFS